MHETMRQRLVKDLIPQATCRISDLFKGHLHSFLKRDDIRSSKPSHVFMTFLIFRKAPPTSMHLRKSSDFLQKKTVFHTHGFRFF